MKWMVLAGVVGAFLIGTWATETALVPIPDAAPVRVTNFPELQRVGGTVEVGNLPAVQPVSGSVEVTNLNSTSRPRVLGFTTETTTGGIGLFTMTQTCRAEFPGSHLCTSRDILEAVEIADLTTQGTDWARIRPVIVASPNQYIAIDISGFTTSGGSMTCSFYGSNGSGAGLTISRTGRFTLSGCDDLLSLACCSD